MDKIKMLNERNEAQDKIDTEHQKLCDIRTQYGEESPEFMQQQAHFSYVQQRYGNSVEYLNEKLYGKQLKLFTATIAIMLASIFSADAQNDSEFTSKGSLSSGNVYESFVEKDNRGVNSYLMSDHTMRMYNQEMADEKLYMYNVELLRAMLNGGYAVEYLDSYGRLGEFLSTHCYADFNCGNIKGKVLTAEVGPRCIEIKLDGQYVGFVLPKPDMMEEITGKRIDYYYKDVSID